MGFNRRKKLLRRKFQKLSTRLRKVIFQPNKVIWLSKIAAQKQIIFQNLKGSNYRKIYDANQLLINGVETVSSSIPVSTS